MASSTLRTADHSSAIDPRPNVARGKSRWFPAHIGFLALGLVFSVSGRAAAEGTIAAAAGLPVLPPVTVIGTFDNPATGQSSIDREVIEALPAGNGSINEILALFPDVQLTEDWRSTAQAGEILPPRFSISGGKTYQNNFLLDGVSNQSLLDPAAGNSIVNDLPGHPQALFPDAGLIGKISIYDSNIPARYGGFTGGVVIAETRDPQAGLAGHLFYRTTRADWTRFHLDDNELPPDYDKQHGGLDLDLPLTADMGLLGSYRQLYSRIPLAYFGRSQAQTRRKEDLFLKYAWNLPAANLRLALLSTPYQAKNFIVNALDSAYTLSGGGTQVQMQYERFLPVGEWQLQASWQTSRSSREAPADMRAWAVTDHHFWGRLIDKDYSLQGGYGDIEKQQQSIGLRTSLALEPIHRGKLVHTPEIGLELETLRGTFERRNTTRIYTAPKLEPEVICGEDDYACSDEEQYFTTRIIYPQGAASARMQRAALYAEDELRLNRFSLRPGLRFSYDDFMENLDIAPRLAAQLDLFGRKQTLLIAGYNRYYGQTLLTYKLREAQIPETYEYRSTVRGFLAEWQRQADRGHDVNRYSRLDTPYSDEWTVGVEQALLGGRLALKYVRRDNKDEFARDYGPRQADGMRIYTLTNHGESRHRSARLGWEKAWPRDFLSINATWQETATSNEDYDEILEPEDLSARIWLDNRFIYRNDFPRQEYNRPWTVNLVYTGKFPCGFSFTNVTRYRSGYEKIVDTRTTRAVPAGEERLNPLTGEILPETVPVYTRKKLADGVVFDWVLVWQSPGEKRHLLLRLEVNNVFNTRLETGTQKEEYEVGRQFWAGAEWSF